MVHPTLDVLTGGDLPVRGADGGTEEADGFPEQLLVDARIPIGAPLTGKVQQVDEYLWAEEPRHVDPLVVEPVEGRAEVDAIPQKPKEALGVAPSRWRASNDKSSPSTCAATP